MVKNVVDYTVDVFYSYCSKTYEQLFNIQGVLILLEELHIVLESLKIFLSTNLNILVVSEKVNSNIELYRDSSILLSSI